MVRHLSAWASLVRVPNSVALALLYISLALTPAPLSDALDVLVTAALWFIVAASAYMANDICDLNIDRINRPERALPSGRVPIRAAVGALGAALSFVVVVSLISWGPSRLLLLGAAFMSIVYSAIIRPRNALAANVTAAVMVGAVPISAISRIGVLPCTLLSIGLVLVMFCRELLKDVVDRAGDAVARPDPLVSNVATWQMRLRGLVVCGGLMICTGAVMVLPAGVSRGIAVCSVASTAILASSWMPSKTADVGRAAFGLKSVAYVTCGALAVGRLVDFASR